MSTDLSSVVNLSLIRKKYNDSHTHSSTEYSPVVKYFSSLQEVIGYYETEFTEKY